MTTIKLFYATNRRHEGPSRWKPTGYGTKFSDDGIENLRFGRLSFEADSAEIQKCVTRPVDHGVGDGRRLSKLLSATLQDGMAIAPYREKIDRRSSEAKQPNARLGSKALFNDLHSVMSKTTDVVIFVHGFNVSWVDAVASAASLQLMLNSTPARDPGQEVQVVLFSWPSDGLALPYVSYKSDRTEAQGSGFAFARGLLKVRDFLAEMRRPSGEALEPCRQDIHLLCHSMGNYVLQNALKRMSEFTPGTSMSRILEHVFLCAPDVDDDVLEPANPLGRIHEIARQVTVYHNRGDKAMHVSDYTKGNPERLGTNGSARPALVHNKVHQVDCSDIVEDTYDEHGYYAWGLTAADIRQSIDGVPADGPARARKASRELPNVWRLEGEAATLRRLG
ncbi:MAG: alpha/beta fold hydrolase [Acidobacteriota bacterium]|nr:alpha/beta fold hydrolase [Acidobacteriota bacterium]